jgi:Holliday junction resolvase RusA-like endonuclease
MTRVEFTVPGDPQSLKRPRVTTIGGHPSMYDPKENRSVKNDIVNAWLEAGMHGWPHGVPLKLTVACFFRRPKGHFGTGKNAAKLKDSAPRFHTSKPDADNVLKIVGDALNGYAWHDDAQIAWSEVPKVYVDPEIGNGPHMRITIEALS